MAAGNFFWRRHAYLGTRTVFQADVAGAFAIQTISGLDGGTLACPKQDLLLNSREASSYIIRVRRMHLAAGENVPLRDHHAGIKIISED